MAATRGRFVLAALAAGLLAVPAAAPASPTQETVFQDDDLLLHAGPHGADATIAELRDLGVERLRVSVIWRNYAPDQPPADPADPRSYPAEQFDPLDHLLRVARRVGLEVLLNVRGGAPHWAMPEAPGRLAGRDGYLPAPAAFGSFAAMLGRRYDGTYEDENQGGAPLPRVGAWSIWNEPNWGGHLQPQTIRDRRRRLVTVAPRHYRRLYRAAIHGLRATGHGGDLFLLGETAPIGNRKLGELSHLRPVRFLRDLFCLDRRLRPLPSRRARRMRCDFKSRGPLHAGGFAHHPYPVTAPPAQPSQDPQFLTFGDGERLRAVLDAAARAGRIPAGLPVWYTEFGYQTAPPDPFRGISLEAQARYLVEAERMAWADERIAGLSHFLLRDDEPRTLFPEGDPRRWGTYQTGLRFEDGTPKPAYDAYRLPMLAPDRVEPGRPLPLWGMVRPGVNGQPQRVRIEFRPEGSDVWTTIAERVVHDPKGYFQEEVESPRSGHYRFEWQRPAGEGGRERATSPFDLLRPVDRLRSAEVAVRVG